MIQNFGFSLALPGAGKSYWINQHYLNIFNFADYVNWLRRLLYMDEYNNNCIISPGYLKMYLDGVAKGYKKERPDCIVIAADDIKPFLPGYDANDPVPVHEESVQLAKKLVQTLAEDTAVYHEVFMDGGGINNHYTSDIITFIREHCPDCKITCYYFDTPVEVCIDRISRRERKVPSTVIYEKNQKIVKCVYKYKDMVDNFVRINYFTNKYILLDMDGTICGYTKARFDEDGNADYVNGELFLHLRPVTSVIEYVKSHYDMKNVFIMTAVPNCIAWEEKNKWLDKYFPEVPVENRYFCGNKDYKYVFVKQLAEYKGWKRNEMVLVDDYHPTIERCKKVGVNCIHPSNIESLTDPFALFN